MRDARKFSRAVELRNPRKLVPASPRAFLSPISWRLFADDQRQGHQRRDALAAVDRSMSSSARILRYVFDPLCAWCYAAAPLEF